MYEIWNSHTSFEANCYGKNTQNNQLILTIVHNLYILARNNVTILSVCFTAFFCNLYSCLPCLGHLVELCCSSHGCNLGLQLQGRLGADVYGISLFPHHIPKRKENNKFENVNLHICAARISIMGCNHYKYQIIQ